LAWMTARGSRRRPPLAFIGAYLVYGQFKHSSATASRPWPPPGC
jgi:hypothetical protein